MLVFVKSAFVPERTEISSQSRVRLTEVRSQRAQRLDPRPIGGRPSAVPRRPPRAVRAALRCVLAQLVGESRLSDAGLPREQEKPTAPGRQRVETFEQQLELALTADHRMWTHTCKLRRAGASFNAARELTNPRSWARRGGQQHPAPRRRRAHWPRE